MNLSDKKRGVDSVSGVDEIRVLWPDTRVGECPEKWNDRKRVQMWTGRNGRHHYGDATQPVSSDKLWRRERRSPRCQIDSL